MAGKLRVRAYSSSANLGPGFDVVAVALDAFFDEVEVRLESGRGNVIVESVYGPYASESGRAETARRAVIELLEITGNRLEDEDIVLRVYKGIPPGRGLGSSGASAAAAVKAVSILLDLDADIGTLVRAAGRGEIVAAGAPHFDSVAASLLGGFTVVAEEVDGTIHAHSIPLQAFFVIYTPRTVLGVGKADFMRRILPERIDLSRAVKNWSRLAMLIVAASTNNLKLLGKMMMQDEIIEPVRWKYVPCYAEARSTALEAGALGVTLSGAGPSLIALVQDEATARDVASALANECPCCDPEIVKIAKVAPGASKI